ncbi:MAG: hypothetical protein NXH75_18185 [Halobacteriovoraceae bacterium]|nr:hypothetical protein [Halobacteriovoraceae bacterium]
MITRAFLLFLLLFSLQVTAKSSGSLFLVARVYPEVIVSMVSNSDSGTSDSQSSYSVSSNMPVGTYKVFIGDFRNSKNLKEKKAFRQLVVEAN